MPFSASGELSDKVEIDHHGIILLLRNPCFREEKFQ